jgi:hypothetical protein
MSKVFHRYYCICHTKERIRNTVINTNDRQLIAVDQQIRAYAIRYLTPVRNELATTVCSIRNKSSGFVAAVVVAGTRQNNNLSQKIIFNLAIQPFVAKSHNLQWISGTIDQLISIASFSK